MPMSRLFSLLAIVIIAAGITVFLFQLLGGADLPLWPVIAGCVGLALAVRLLTRQG